MHIDLTMPNWFGYLLIVYMGIQTLLSIQNIILSLTIRYLERKENAQRRKSNT